jgi:hypothetical protein
METPADILEAPKFTSVLADATLVRGSTLELKCSVVGSPPPSVSWFRDGEQLRPSVDGAEVLLPFILEISRSHNVCCFHGTAPPMKKTVYHS